MVRRSAPKTRADLSEGSPGTARMVTCRGYRGSTLARVSCGIDGRPRGFRPAPFRAPPHLRGARRGNRSCRLPADLISRMSRCRHGPAPGCVAIAGIYIRGRRRNLIPRMLGGDGACERRAAFAGAGCEE